jgi:hypothetical protein
MSDTRSCVVCGCTDSTGCSDQLTGPCWWVGERLCSHCAQPDPRRRLALVAASQLSDVVAELLRFAREGDQEVNAPFSIEPAEHAADALRAILRIECAVGFPLGARYPEEHDQLIAAIARFLEGWA